MGHAGPALEGALAFGFEDLDFLAGGASAAAGEAAGRLGLADLIGYTVDFTLGDWILQAGRDQVSELAELRHGAVEGVAEAGAKILEDIQVLLEKGRARLVKSVEEIAGPVKVPANVGKWIESTERLSRGSTSLCWHS